MSANAFSVVIPTYNRARLVGRSIQSVLAAVEADDEILVVDDGSTDNTAEVVASFGSRVRFLPVPHGGAGAARNAGIRASTRPFIAFLDSDDTWDSDKLALQRALFAALPNVLFLFSDFRGQDEVTQQIEPNYINIWSQDPRSWDEILGPGVAYSQLAPLPAGRADFQVHVGDMYLPLLERFYMAANTLAVRRELAGDALRFAEDVPNYEDLECFARLARAGQAAFMNCEIATQLGHSGPRITDTGTERMSQCLLTVYERIWGQDEAFLARHGATYARSIEKQRLLRARWLLCRGRMSEARAELAHLKVSPRSYRLLATMPGFVARGLLGVRRVVRGAAQ